MSDFDPERWLQVAEHCCRAATGADREAYLRTALNRAYYAALLTTKRRIDDAVGAGVLPRTRTHTTILETVRTGGRRFEHIQRLLYRFKRFRETSDYELARLPLGRRQVYLEVRKSRWLIRNHIKALPDAEFRKLKVPAK